MGEAKREAPVRAKPHPNGSFYLRRRLPRRPGLLFFRVGIAVHPFLATLRTVPVGKSGFGMDLDIIFDALPVVLSVSNLFATAADREKALELVDMPVQAEDTFGDLNPGCQFVRVERLGNKVIRPGIHCFEIIGLAFERGKQDEVAVIFARYAPDLPKKSRSVHLWHQPI